MSYRIEILPSALKALQGIPIRDRRRIDARIVALSENPRPRGCKRLQATGEPLWRLRVGLYRVVYALYDSRLTVLVIRVGSRRDVYRGLK